MVSVWRIAIRLGGAPSRGWLPVFEVLVTRRPSAVFNGLANINATLGSFYWLGFETSGLPPDKKRLALLGAQRKAHPRLVAVVECQDRVEVMVAKNHRNGTATSGWMVLCCYAPLYSVWASILLNKHSPKLLIFIEEKYKLKTILPRNKPRLWPFGVFPF